MQNLEIYNSVPEENRGKAEGLLTSHELHYRRLDAQAKLLLSFRKDRGLQQFSLLDVGCGYGELYDKLKTKYMDFDYVGLENVEWIYKTAKSKYPHVQFRNVTLEDFVLSGKGHRFDVVNLMGLLPTMNEIEAFKLLQYATTIADDYVSFSWLDKANYKGSLKAYTLTEIADFVERLGCRQYLTVPVKDDKSYMMGLIKITEHGI